MAGGFILAIAMVLVVPPLVMLTGAVWSAVLGTLSVEDAERRADGQRP